MTPHERVADAFDRDVQRIVDALRDGRVAVIPTDTVYGLAADPRSPAAMKRLFELKGRPEGVPIAVLVGSVSQARGLVTVSSVFAELAEKHWPGALTIVAPALEGSDLHIGALDTIGVRLPDHDLVRACAERFGPIAATSANHHGEPTIVDPDGAVATFGDDVAVVVDGGVLDGTASTVVDVTKAEVEVLRQGVVRLDQAN